MHRILLVDDDALILHALSRILQAEGYHVIVHSDPEEAARERDFKVVITDFMMPKLNGIQLLDLLKKQNPTAVRILLTAASDFKVASDAVNRGEIYRLLGKPWTLSELTTCVRQAVAHYEVSAENERLTNALESKNKELTALNRDLERLVVERTNGLLDGLVCALDYRDTETQWHSRRVALYTRRLAEEYGLSGPALDVVEHGALLHDVGKIAVRDSILLKPGPLTPDEWVEMQRHPEFGYQLLIRVPYLREPAEIVLHHQERWDGGGYPQKLRGNEIVLGARIFAVADAMDAITTDRPYRKGRAFQVCRDEIRRCRGTQFDPNIVDLFMQVPDSAWLNIREHVERLEQVDLQRWQDHRGESRPALHLVSGSD